MTYRVDFTRRAHRDLDTLYGHISAAGSPGAAKWFNRLQETVSLLETTPLMGKVTREDADAREIIYGNKPHLYRIIYRVRERERRIVIVTIRHGRQLPPRA